MSAEARFSPSDPSQNVPFPVARPRGPKIPWKDLAWSLGCMALGSFMLWSTWNEVAHTGRFGIKASILAPLMLGGGLVWLVSLVLDGLDATHPRLHWATSVVILVLCALAVIGCVMNPYLLYHYKP